MTDTCDYKSKYIFTWSIENFVTYFVKRDANIVSPVFTAEPFRNSKWQLLLSFKSSRWPGPPIQLLSCHLQRSEPGVRHEREKLQIGCNIEVIGSSRKLRSALVGVMLKEFSKGDQVELFSHFGVDKQTTDNEKASGDVMTIRLTMLSKEFYETRHTECIARTKVGGDQCSFEWKFGEKNFLQTKTFPCFPGMQIELLVNSKFNESIKVVVKKTAQNLDDAFLLCVVSFTDINGTKIGTKRSAGWFPEKANEWEFHADITDNFLKQQCAMNGFVTLLCECLLSNRTLHTELKYIQIDTSQDTAIQTLQGDFQRMYLEKILSDVKLKVADEIFLAHKCVLCARSSVFLAMFSQDMTEYKKSFVYISDIDPEIFALFLKFLYIGETEIDDWEAAVKLLLCADKYQVMSLKERCSSFLMADLCETNACKILVAADMVRMELLKSSAIRRIRVHASRIFKSSSDWIEILESHTKLAAEVLSILSSELSE